MNSERGSNGHRTRCYHTGQAVRVGDYWIFAGGSWYLERSDYEHMDMLVVLNGKVPNNFEGQIVDLELPDFGGVPDDWQEILETEVIPRLRAGDKILAFCTASHGRTGTLLASLIALLESAEETPDPIKAVRERHCEHAVESPAQEKAIFALRGQTVPEICR